MKILNLSTKLKWRLVFICLFIMMFFSSFYRAEAVVEVECTKNENCSYLTTSWSSWSCNASGSKKSQSRTVGKCKTLNGGSFCREKTETESTPCPYGCSDGACNSAPPAPGCGSATGTCSPGTASGLSEGACVDSSFKRTWTCTNGGSSTECSETFTCSSDSTLIVEGAGAGDCWIKGVPIFRIYWQRTTREMPRLLAVARHDTLIVTPSVAEGSLVG